jgi:hypothetical protein
MENPYNFSKLPTRNLDRQLSVSYIVAKMPYPETTTGFAVNDTKNWSTFKKQEVR